jgi:hypothetical protein
MGLADLPRRVGWELYRVGLAEVGGPAHVAPSAVLGQELLVETDRAFDSVHTERQVVGDIAAFGDLNEDRSCACRVACGSIVALPNAAIHGADSQGVGLGDVVDSHRGAGPVGPKAARLDDHDLHAERRGLGPQHPAEAVDRELGGLVRGDPR